MTFVGDLKLFLCMTTPVQYVKTSSKFKLQDYFFKSFLSQEIYSYLEHFRLYFFLHCRRYKHLETHGFLLFNILGGSIAQSIVRPTMNTTHQVRYSRQSEIFQCKRSLMPTQHVTNE